MSNCNKNSKKNFLCIIILKKIIGFIVKENRHDREILSQKLS